MLELGEDLLAFHATLCEKDKIVDVQDVYFLGDEIAFEVLFGALLAVIASHLSNWTFRIHGATGHLHIMFGFLHSVLLGRSYAHAVLP